MPSWLSTFISDWLSVSPFFAISDAIWNALMTACTGLMITTPQWFSTEAWQYVRFELYPWALSIGIASLNLFFIMGFFKAASNLKENITLELLIESLFKLVVLNVLLVNGLTIITTLFNMSSALAGNVMMMETPAFFTGDVDAGSRLFFFLFGLLYFIVALVCGFLILITLYGRYIKLYVLIVFYPIAMPTLIGGRGVEHTAYAWGKSFLSNVFEIVTIALVMGIAGRIVSGITPFTDNAFAEVFDGFAQALNSTIYMILMAVSVKGAAAFMNKTFNL